MRKKLFPYPGAKTAVVKELISYFPSNYIDLTWVEAFGGSGVLTYLKKPSALEVFNDLDQGISAIFYCLLFRFEELAYRLEQFAQHSESILRWTQTDAHLSNNPSIVDLAITKLYQMCYSFGSMNQTIRFFRNPDSRNRMQSTMNIYADKLYQNWRKRFRNVQLMCRPANEIIPLFDSKQMFVYCDPPYTVTEKGLHYDLNFTVEDHQELAASLAAIEGKFLLSYDDVPLIQELYGDYYMTDLVIPYQLSSTNKSRVRELLISNYPLVKQQSLLHFL